jgi:hypothetical protein
MMFLDCPAYMDQDGAIRCGLPAEVSRRFIMNSTDGPLESVMIRCPAGHWFNGPIEFLTWDRTDRRDSGQAAPASSAGEIPAEPGPDNPRPNSAPAYYLGRPARLWITALRPSRSRSRTASDHLVGALAATDSQPERMAMPVPERRSA